jgi:hypothetical protein
MTWAVFIFVNLQVGWIPMAAPDFPTEDACWAYVNSEEFAATDVPSLTDNFECRMKEK